MSEEQRIRIPNIRDVRRAINLQTQLQREVLDQRPHDISPHMTAQEVFDAYSATNEFQTFTHQMTQLSYCPPDEWDLFRTIVRGHLNELIAIAIISTKALKIKNAIVLDSAHSKHIIKALFPDAKETDHGVDYGIESSSLRVGSTHLPSPDAMIVVKGNLRTFCETSLREKGKDWNYWRRKRARFRDTRNHFRRLGRDFDGLFTYTNCNLVMTRVGYENRKRMGLLRNMTPTEFTRLPYSRNEFDEFFDGIIPRDPPHTYRSQDENDKVHWRELLEVPEDAELDFVRA